VAATDYVRAYAEQIRPYVPGRYTVLGTDGFGRSDWRRTLRSFFEVDRRHVVVAALKALADDGALEPSVVQDAIDRYELEVEEEAPWRR
jgi:pyruvate dehydrogenase E1 component